MLITLIACIGEPVLFTDNIETRIDLGTDDALTTPYVKSAAFELTLAPGFAPDITDWSLESSEPEILEIGARRIEDGKLIHTATAHAPGEVELQAIDDKGKLVDAAVVEVKAPTRLGIAHNSAVATDDETVYADEVPLVLVDGTSTWRVEYFAADDEKLHGQAQDLTVAAEEFAGAELLLGVYHEASDFAQATPTEPGTYTIDVSIGELSEQIPFEAVPLEALAGLALDRTPEDDDTAEEIVVVFGENDEGRSIAGVHPAWVVNGVEKEEQGDVLFYQSNDADAVDNPVTASFEGHELSFDIHANAADVFSTNEPPGCSTSGLAASLSMVLAGLLAARRRRA